MVVEKAPLAAHQATPCHFAYITSKYRLESHGTDAAPQVSTTIWLQCTWTYKSLQGT